MHKAAQGGSLDVINFLLTLFGARVHEKTNNSSNMLHCAAQKGHYQVARYLITELKLDPQDRDKVCGVPGGAGRIYLAGSPNHLPCYSLCTTSVNSFLLQYNNVCAGMTYQNCSSFHPFLPLLELGRGTQFVGLSQHCIYLAEFMFKSVVKPASLRTT